MHHERLRLGGEASERATHVAFTQALERAVAQLPDALARDAEHRTDFLERVLTSAFETEVETQHLCIARRQCAERLLDFVVQETIHRFLTDEIEQALGTLPPRDAKVLRLYFGLEGGREHTLEEIGSMLGVTRERVRQLRDRALKRLREGDVGRALGSFAA